MAKLNYIWNYIISALSLMSFYQEPITVEKTSIGQYWENVGGYMKNSMKHHEQEITKKSK